MDDLEIKLTFFGVVCTEPKRLFSIQRNIVKVLEDGEKRKYLLKNNSSILKTFIRLRRSTFFVVSKIRI